MRSTGHKQIRRFTATISDDRHCRLCCARAVNGHTAATPTNVMKSRRLIVVGPED